MKNKFSLIDYILMVATVAVIFLFWTLSTNLGWLDVKLCPTPQKVWDAFIELCKNGYMGNSLAVHFFSSMKRLLIAFVLAAITAVPLGLASGYSSKVRAILEPVIEFYRPLPPLAYYTLLVLWMGINDESKIALLFLACFAPIYIACSAGVMKIGPNFLHNATTLGASKWQSFVHVIFPFCMPEMFVGMRTALGVGYTTLIASEMVAARSGIGWVVLDAYKWMRSDIVFAGIIIMGVTGIILDRILHLIEKKTVPWKGRE